MGLRLGKRGSKGKGVVQISNLLRKVGPEETGTGSTNGGLRKKTLGSKIPHKSRKYALV